MPRRRASNGWMAPNITFGRRLLHISYVETRLKIGFKGSKREREREREIGFLDRRVSCYKVIGQCIPNMQ